MTDPDDDELSAELADFALPPKPGGRSARAERIIAGFEDIQRFVHQHARPPQHGEDRDIFERLYAVRLDRLRTLHECREVLAPFDHQDLLATSAPVAEPQVEELTDDELLDELQGGIEATDITTLRHVRPTTEKRTPDEIANREKCEDFAQFQPLFERVQSDLNTGLRQTKPFERKSEIAAGRFYILGGQKAYVAAMEEPFTNENNYTDARLRVIFDNGTQANLLMRSLQRALQKDHAGRRIIEPAAGPLFADNNQEGDEPSGTVYVLRSKSDHPMVAANRTIVHKIGITGTDMARRIANARLDPTFLMADVETVATYKLYDLNRTRLENIIHRVFDSARLNIEVTDRFGNSVIPREWFLVPLQAIDQAIDRIKDGSITRYVYNPQTASLTQTVEPRPNPSAHPPPP
jgi:hypothetical protein